jgi:hypothetical protein
LIPNYSNSGAKNKPRQQTASKPGAKPKSIGTVGKALTDADHSNFERAIRKYYLNQQKRSPKSTYEKLLQEFYATLSEDAKLKLLEPSELPSLRQFQYWYSKNRDIAAESKKRNGERDFDLNKRAVTGKYEYGLIGPGAQFQVDATIGDVYLVSRFDRSDIVGRPIIYFIIDAFSRMAVGMGVGLRGRVGTRLRIQFAGRIQANGGGIYSNRAVRHRENNGGNKHTESVPAGRRAYELQKSPTCAEEDCLAET